MRHRNSTLRDSTFSCVASLAIMLMPVTSTAHSNLVNLDTGVARSATQNRPFIRPIVGDDPVAIRDALERQHASITPPSVSDRVRSLIPGLAHERDQDPDLAAINLDRDVVFVVPISYGVRYRSEKQLLTINVDLASGDGQTGILLRKVTTGPRGQALAVAPEAKSKGYVQHVDIIELESGRDKRTIVHQRVRLSPTEYAETKGDLAIVLSGRLVQPYLTDRSDHADPSNEEPTDITIRTSSLHFRVHAIWLVNPSRGAVLSKSLKLSN
ncbi:hypothetical protein [Burkholderia catarinensis]|uniref:hypothetical protein n=1 Tax=Burkholderia catarinensis TaxID=1108140 RepID=UPI0009200966|nr:hypothetical protein [Burkholderia catarinensis]KAG8155015.1 hypothetical protein BFF94_005365 [Burkholderia catarinensis]